MTYQQGGLIQVSDFNNLVGTSTSSTAEQLNSILAIGNGRGGLGQSAINQIPLQTISNITKVTPTDWNNLRTAILNLGNHQGSTVTSMPTAEQYAVITASMTPAPNPVSIFSSNLTTLWANRNNVAAQGSSSAVTTTRSATWYQAVTFTNTITFSSGNAARYFFNAGGQIALTFTHPTGSNINDLWNKLAIAAGTLVISGTNSGTQTIAGTVYNGVTKVGGSGSATISQNSGYYSLTGTTTQIFNQVATVGPTGYLTSFLRVSIKSNGAQGSNGDAGSIITITTVWDTDPNGVSTTRNTAAAGTAVTCTIRPPSTSYVTNTWGTVDVTGSQTGT